MIRKNIAAASLALTATVTLAGPAANADAAMSWGSEKVYSKPLVSGSKAPLLSAGTVFRFEGLRCTATRTYTRSTSVALVLRDSRTGRVVEDDTREGLPAGYVVLGTCR